MTGKTQTAVREALRANPDGLTVRQLEDITDTDLQNIRTALAAMPDAYLHEWRSRGHARGPTHEQVWRVVVPPPNAKPPKGTYAK